MARFNHTTSRRLALAVLLVTAAPCGPALAQDSPETPEHVAQQFTAALRDTNWLRMASLMHPSALSLFRSLFTPVLDCSGDEAAQVIQTLFGAASAADARRTSDTVLVAALFRAASSREEGMAAFLRTAQMRVIGHLPEGADTVHVLTRLTFSIEDIPISTIEVISLQRFRSSWRVLLKADISALAAALQGLCGGSE